MAQATAAYITGPTNIARQFARPPQPGPVTLAVRSVRDTAIERLLSARHEPPQPEPEKKPFGLNRERLRSLTMNGLLALHDAYEAVAGVFCHHANAPRVDACDRPCGILMDVASESAQWARTEIAAEVESRQPADLWDQERRLGFLIRWRAEGEEWGAVLALAGEAERAVTR